MPGTAYGLQNKLKILNVNVFTGTGAITMLNEGIVVVNKGTGAATTVHLTPSPERGDVVFIKDGKGDAAAHNITISDPASATIDGAANYVISTNYGAVVLEWNGTQWNVLSYGAIGLIVAGGPGAAGTFTLYPATTGKGTTTFTMANNSGNTLTNINVAAQGGARTFTIPDLGGSANFVMAPQTEGSNGLFPTELRLMEFKTITGTTLPASATTGIFGYAITLGTNLYLIGETSNNSTKTDSAIIEYVLPPWYVAGQNLTVTVNAGISTGGSPTYATKTVQVLCYPTADAGTQSADIGPGSASAITVAGADVTFTITGTSLVPGQRMTFEVQTVLHDTGSVNCNAVINSVRVS